MSLKDPNVTNPAKRKRIALVIANPAVSTTTGWPVGFWWAELSHPYYVFTEHGYEVEIFSPAGGKCEADAMSDPNDPSGYSNGNGPARGQMALAPSNQFNAIGITGLYKLPSHTTVNGIVRFIDMSQNESLLPWSTNASITNSTVMAAFPALAASGSLYASRTRRTSASVNQPAPRASAA